MKLGISSNTYAWAVGLPCMKPEQPLSAMELLERAAELGVGIVQFGSNLPLEHLPQSELREVLEHARSWGIDIEMATRGIEPPHLKNQIAFAKRNGIIVLQTTPELQDGNIPLQTEVRNCLLAIVNDLERAEIPLAIDNSRVPAPTLNEVLSSIGSPWLGAALDTVAPLAICEGWTLSVRILAHRTITVHVKDFCTRAGPFGVGLITEGRQVGTGQLNFPWMVRSLSALRVHPSLIVESWTPQQGTLQETVVLEDTWARRGLDFARRFMPD